MSVDDPPDDVALLAAASTDVAAFEEIYRRYVRRVTGFAASRCSSADDVADVVAQTFYRLIGAAERYEPERAEPLRFVLGIAANVVREQHRGRTRHQRLAARVVGRDLLDEAETDRVDAAIDATRRVRGLGPTLDAIPAGEHDVLRLVAAGRTPGQAAAELGISPGAARIRLSRARRRFRREATTPAGHELTNEETT
jgi:RNA polymerase sigma-70 factor (ECF subfamily)